ncbi:hypothetical protein AB5I41_07315 [Sphingomonas sp. MMS24-JH45]
MRGRDPLCPSPCCCRRGTGARSRRMAAIPSRWKAGAGILLNR